MTIQEIASRLVEVCKEGKWNTAHEELYAQDAISIEPYATPDFEKEVKGLDAIIAKGKKFQGMVEAMHSIEISDPLIAGNSFACALTMDVTMKEGGHMKMTELCVYQVKDGKIIAEQFFM